jgi:hypothetical protein
MLPSECDYYGASGLISQKLKLDHVPASHAMWAHGWKHYPCKHLEVYKWAWHGQDLRLLVHRMDEEQFLRGCGFDAIAVGAPYLYVDPMCRKKLPRSLLIVPYHTLDNSPRDDYDEEAYFSAIEPFLRKFDHVAACIHPSCARQGIWLRGLQRRSIPWITGAEVSDRNALRRMRGIFEPFTHVTSNSIGSHIPYAASCNCSVSIYGPQPKIRYSDWYAHPFYKEHPQILEWMVDLERSRFVENTYAWLFREPATDANDRDWALEQLGHSNMKTPLELAELFGWDIPDSARSQTEKAEKLSLVQRLLRLSRLS